MVRGKFDAPTWFWQDNNLFLEGTDLTNKKLPTNTDVKFYTIINMASFNVEIVRGKNGYCQ